MKQKLRPYLNLLYPVAAFLVFFAVWFLVAEIIGIELILPTPVEAFRRLFQLMTESEGSFWIALGGTLGRTLWSFALGYGVALILSVVAYLVKPVGRLFQPIVLILRATPTMSIILLSLIWLSSKTAPVLIAFLIVFPILYASFVGSLEGVDKSLIDMAKLYRVPKTRMIAKIFIPSILPDMFVAVRSTLSLNVKIMISAEVLAQTVDSMGLQMQISKVYFDTAELMAWTIAAVVLSYLLELAVESIKRLVVRWQ